MPKRTDITSIMIIGAGPIVIGQACEFDYSGAQACKALREEGYRVILVNSNPATIMTDPGLADATYIEPITPEVVAKIIEKERPDALLPTMGGQTGLNTSLALEEAGVLEKFGVEMIGAKRPAIEMAEDRKLFREAMDRIGLENPKATIVSAPKLDTGKYDIAAGLQSAIDAIEYVGLPAIIRPAFTLGGTGGGVAYNREEYEHFCRSGLEASPVAQILIDESLLGWKEYEMEVVRDKADNAIIVCAIENVDPMGVHTGDSITVAPALTLTDKEYQIMRNGSIAVLREIGVETGGSNVQWAVNPADGRMVVIEMNPRVSRSSALASKATGFPIAKIAAKLAVGYTLDELDNDITKVTPASFEPTIDYVVTKIPRFAFEKFPGSEPYLTTAMKSVGEAMSIGRSFHESVQKALASMETGLTGFDEIDIPGAPDPAAITKALSAQTPDRLRVIAQAMRHGLSDDDIQAVTSFDPWFLARIREIIDAEEAVRADGLPSDEAGLRSLKMMGFTDARLAKLTGRTEASIRADRVAQGVTAVFKRIDTCAAEFEAQTPYMYSTYEAPVMGEVECEARPSDAKKVVILGGGPNRIGQGIEFDYCCCHACFALTDAGYETIMVNCNPETVSTDYDTSDRLYFEPLTFEHVMEILRVEQENGTLHGVIVQFGGQTPLKLANALHDAGIPILGTTPDAIDLAEDRERFQQLVQRLGLKQPQNAIATTDAEAKAAAEQLGYPLVIRPSYVLGGRAMEIVRDTAQLDRYIAEAVVVSGDSPVLLDSYLAGATEVDVDCLSDGTDTHVAGIMQHIEEAGVHSGDSACSLPPHTLSDDIIAEITRQTEALAKALNVIGLMNIQFAVKDGEIYLIEVNPRASRTVPFVAKATDSAIASIAARLMAGEPLSSFPLTPRQKPVPDDVDLPQADPMTLADFRTQWFSVKEAVMPFARFPGVDTILGPEMRSTGEVMGWDRTFPRAFLKAQLGAGTTLPDQGTVFLSIKDDDKTPHLIETAKTLTDLGLTILATRGTASFLAEHDIASDVVNKAYEGGRTIVDIMKDGHVALVMNTTEGAQAVEDSRSMRAVALYDKIPYFTTLAASHAAALAMKAAREGELGVRSLQG
ncbi:carbamoyl-phosphate synthase large subunit [Roseobacter sp. HKCCD9010]|uniref:carbamoyl-phosphate synthase large subunit n=1 Tax=unclassified Roseobacter TaxID=196798 RepID=UPI0014922E8F|nr:MULTISPECIES: carbamoyl-phosphate synthase large subunit [unclassified Roseobacter]MBF9051275.1 carbamoyl-phosphate synthase large subunit [Rhodobacterales bacterium HKCCD4356]NNV13322.1 carbamoyl-phosphate synthase large subunit [Roseobacter sp. HKCCD7357]NNV17573.1 carbamoyl-phosphate synthase large subunit [Roseobacter sp. HKCCD8768]NNV27179.1 carbamoyl-phosphate synthase large subunit [Roseobacter sp. HKCCD8192]NNV31299.1 carbamoyl-phosphate synthase large subunit [Roseobacter sp. HKCCD